MPSFSFPAAERLVPRYAEITSGPQQRLYERGLWDEIPLPLLDAGSGLWNDSGVLALTTGANYPTDDTGLLPGDLWNNDLTIAVVPGMVPNSLAPAVFFGSITATDLLILGGGNLPTALPAAQLQLWNNHGEIAVA